MALFALPAQLVETERRQRSDQRKARDQRIEQRHQALTEGHGRRQQPDHRVDEAKEHGVSWHRPEIVDAAGQCVANVRQFDVTDPGLGVDIFRPGDDVEVCHGHPSELSAVGDRDGCE